MPSPLESLIFGSGPSEADFNVKGSELPERLTPELNYLIRSHPEIALQLLGASGGGVPGVNGVSGGGAAKLSIGDLALIAAGGGALVNGEREGRLQNLGLEYKLRPGLSLNAGYSSRTGDRPIYGAENMQSVFDGMRQAPRYDRRVMFGLNSEF